MRVLMPWPVLLAQLAAGAAISAILSYAFALVGEPRAVWFWRDILGVM